MNSKKTLERNSIEQERVLVKKKRGRPRKEANNGIV